MNYIVYNPDTLKIIGAYQFYGAHIVNLITNCSGAKWINVTHPKHKEILKLINEANKTNYGHAN